MQKPDQIISDADVKNMRNSAAVFILEGAEDISRAGCAAMLTDIGAELGTFVVNGKKVRVRISMEFVQ